MKRHVFAIACILIGAAGIGFGFYYRNGKIAAAGAVAVSCGILLLNEKPTE